MKSQDKNAANIKPADIRSGSVLIMLSLLLVVTIGIALILHHRDTVNNALDTGQCLVARDVKGFFEFLRHLLHQAYRWIFRACG
ncbi:hypothetical protein [Pantoea agglomerans]|nr:hypothetical protein [Pantoea agglomerans]WVL84150.1 hypothetical protein IFU02_016880 [Pantoea agglomerans]